MVLFRHRVVLLIIEILVVAATYYVAARLGLSLAFQKTNASPVWPPSGIAFGLVILRGYKVLPGILIGAVLANMDVFIANGISDISSIIGVSCIIGIGNTLEALFGVFLLQRFISAHNPLESARYVFWFVLTVFFMCIVASTIGSTVMCVANFVPWSVYGTVWFTWWLGDVMGILVITPLVVVWSRDSLKNINRYLVGKAMFVFTLLCIVVQLIFGAWFHNHIFHQMLAFTLIPIIVWTAFCLGERGVVISSFLISVIAIWGTIEGRGPFVRATLNDSMLILQAFIGTSTITGMLLAAVLKEQKQEQQALGKFYADLRERTNQLEAANKELESFTSSVSHDLRSPLRSMCSFSQILLEHSNHVAMDEEVRDACQRITAATKHMAQLIDDLLNLSRVSRSELRCEAVDLSVIVRTLVDALKMQAPERNVNFIIRGGQLVVGDSHLLHIALKNLLENAWKFTNKKSQATIEFGERTENNVRVFFIRDNGVGFDMLYANKLFHAFSRLHASHEFPGTGIGLATVQRVILRHGGRLWAEGAVEQGATFYFTLS